MADDFDPYYTWLGIRPEEQPPDHYRLIGLRQFENNADVIANASDRQMQFLRSMQVGKRSAQSQALLNEISAAGGCLLDPQRKAKYDQELRAKEAAKAQGAKAAAAKAKPLPKAALLEPLPKNDIFSVQMPAAPTAPAKPTTPSHSGASLTPAKAAPAKSGISPALLAGAIGGALVLVSLVAGIGYMISGGSGRKNTAAVTTPKTPEKGAPINSNIPPTTPTVPTVSPAKPKPAEPEKSEPVPEEKTEPAAKAETPTVASPSEPPKSDWQPPAPDSTAAFRSLLGTYMYSNDRTKTYPIVNLQVPRKNLWTPEIQEKVRGKVPYDEISYAGTAKIAVPADGMYVLDTEKSARVQIDGQVVADWDTPKGEIRIAGGVHDFTIEIGSHGGNWMRECQLAIRQKETGQEVPFFNSWQDIQKFLATPVNGQSVTEVSGWQPTAENELQNYGELLASAGVARPGDPGGSKPRETTSPAVAKVAVPDAAALDKARKQLVDVFGDEGRGASTPEKKVELAKKMLQVETESRNDPALQYALLDNARKLFAAAGEAEQALAAVDTLGGQFELDPWPLKTETATTVSDANVLPPARDQIAARLLKATDEAISAQKFAAAEDFARLAAKVSAKGKDIELRKSITQKRADLSRLKQHFAKVEEARDKLATAADDAEANLVVGKFTALGLADFDAGVPYLAKSGQGLYVAAAAADVQAIRAEKGAALLAADAWNKLAESLKAEDKAASTVAQRRARDWYEFAATEIQGLEKVRIERRLKELQGLATTNPRKANVKWRTTQDGFPLVEGVWNELTMPVVITQNEGAFSATCEYRHPTDGQIRWQAEGKISKDGQISITLRHVQAPQSWAKVQTRNGQLNPVGKIIQGDATFPGGKHAFTWKLVGQSSTAASRPSKPGGRGKAISGMVGRGYAEGKDVNLFFTYHPGYKLTRGEIQTLQNNLGNNNASVNFLCTLTLSADAEVAFHHVGGSSSRGVHHLMLDGKEIHAVGDNRTKDNTLTLSLGKGDHLVGWVLTGGDFGDAQLEINLAKSGKNPSATLDIHAPAEMVAAFRAPGVRQEFEYGTSPREASTAAKPAPKGPEKVARTTGRRPNRVPGKFDAVAVKSAGGGSSGKDLVDGWEFKLTEALLITELGVYDDRQNGLDFAHEVAIWDLENEKEPVVKGRVPAGEEAFLVGMFRCVSVERVELKADRRYAIVAHYLELGEPNVSLVNPGGLSIEYAPVINVLGRRCAFPTKTMAFPDKLYEGVTQAMIGPTFRFDAVAKKK